MKKKINKKVKNKKLLMFGILGFFAIAIVSAGLVNYLSNTSVHDIDVSSPIEISDFNGDLSAYGGETKIISTQFTNLAEAEIDGRIEITISSYNISTADFSSLLGSFADYSSSNNWSIEDINMLAIEGLIESVEDNGNEIVITTTNQVWSEDRVWDADLEITFEDNVEGNYNVAVQVIPVN